MLCQNTKAMQEIKQQIIMVKILNIFLNFIVVTIYGLLSRVSLHLYLTDQVLNGYLRVVVLISNF